MASLFNNPPATNNNAAPRAYLNYIFFDEQYNFVKEVSGFKRVSSPGDGQNNLVTDEIRVRKNGYVYVYLSNESGEPVYFDNFSVSHERGRLVAEDHYYAYGLKIASISSRSVSSSLNPNLVKFGYQGSFAEEVSEFELNYNEFALRTYDPQIGRWTTPDPYDEFASPYLGMGTNPANLVDPDGGSVFGSILSFFGGGVSGSTASALAQVACPGASAGFTAAASTLVTAIRITAVSLTVGGAVQSHFAGKMMGDHRSSMLNIAGGSPVHNGGAERGGGVSEPGDILGQALNDNISTNAGNDERVSRHGPNINTEAITPDDLEPDDDWKDLYKEDIKKYILVNEGNPNPTEQDIGNRFERLVQYILSDMSSMKPYQIQRNNQTFTGGDRNTKPDFTGRIPIQRWQKRPTVRYWKEYADNGYWIEVKAKKGGLYLSSQEFQMEGHIDNIRRENQANIDKYKEYGFMPVLTLITTADVSYSPGIAAEATLRGVMYSHFKVQYRQSSSGLKFRIVNNLAE